MMASPRDENSRWSRSSTAISGRHSRHQVAQKFRTMTIPRCSVIDSCRASSVLPLNWGGTVREVSPRRSRVLRRDVSAGSLARTAGATTATSRPKASSPVRAAGQAGGHASIAAGRLGVMSALADHLLDTPEEGVAINNRRPAVLDNPLLADDALRIDEKK